MMCFNYCSRADELFTRSNVKHHLRVRSEEGVCHAVVCGPRAETGSIGGSAGLGGRRPPKDPSRLNTVQKLHFQSCYTNLVLVIFKSFNENVARYHFSCQLLAWRPVNEVLKTESAITKHFRKGARFWNLNECPPT